MESAIGCDVKLIVQMVVRRVRTVLKACSRLVCMKRFHLKLGKVPGLCNCNYTFSNWRKCLSCKLYTHRKLGDYCLSNGGWLSWFGTNRSNCNRHLCESYRSKSLGAQMDWNMKSYRVGQRCTASSLAKQPDTDVLAASRELLSG